MESATRPSNQTLKSPLAPRVERVTRTLSSRAQWRLLTLILLCSDLALAGFAFRLAYWFRFELSIAVFRLEVIPKVDFYRSLSILLIVVWLGIFAASGLYSRRNLLGGFQEYSLVFRATTVGMLLIVIAGFLEPDLLLARGWLLLSWLLVLSFVSIGRFGLRRVVYLLRKEGFFVSPSLIIGTNEEGVLLAQQLAKWYTSGLHVVGFVDNTVQPASPLKGGLQTVGHIDQLERLVDEYGIEELILATSALSREQIVDIFSRYGMRDDLSVRLSSGLFEIITTGLEVKEMASVPLVRVNKVRLTGADHTLKLILDYSFALPGLIAIAPLLLILAIVVKLDSPGPVLYRRRVMGINGKQFDAYKFRTMHVDGDAILAEHPELQKELQQNHKLKDDPRITRVGHILRKYSLDELPQLLNVLKREMSLVGPRMISPSEMPMYAQWGMNLLTVPPGITGLWQVSGRSDIVYAERVQLDMQYIRNWSIWLDLQILSQTPMAVIRGRGAY